MTLQLVGNGQKDDGIALAVQGSSAKGGGGYLSSFVEAIFWAIGAAVVGGIQHRLRGGGEVSHRVAPGRGG